MAGPEITIGRYVSGGSQHFMETGSSIQRSTVGPAAAASGEIILQSMGGRVGMRHSTGTYYRLFIQATTGSSVPGNVLAYTNERFTNTPFNGANEGEFVQNLQIPITVVPGNSLLAFGATSRVGALSTGMDVTAASAIYQRAVSSGSIPANGYTSVPANGRHHIFARGELNVRPNMPGPVTVTESANPQRPVMSAGFSDPNETLRDGRQYDRLEAHYHELSWGGRKHWDASFEGSPAERANRLSQRQVGIDIPFDTPYTYAVWHVDRRGLWSLARIHNGVIASGASFDAPSSPSGRVTDPANPGNIVATYRHSGNLSANAVQVRLVAANESPIRTSNILTRTVASGSSTTVTWAQSGFGAQPLGAVRGVQISARDTNNNWSQWSRPVWFNVNDRPNIPIVHSPPDNYLSSALSHLQIIASDPDQPFGELSAEVELRNSAGTSVLGTVAMEPNPTAQNRFWVVPNSVITSYQEFRWRARVFDGFVWSNYSPSTRYRFLPAPVVTITGPSSPVNTSQPTITWNSTNQTHWRVRGYQDGVLVYDTGVQAGGAKLHTINGGGYWQSGERWRNTETIYWTVSIRDTTTLWGDSEPVAITLEYDPVDPLIITGNVESFPGVQGTHYHHVSISPTEYPQGEFMYYRHIRTEVTSENGAPIPGTASETLVDTPVSTSWRDFEVKSRTWYRHTVSQVVRVGLDVIESDPASIDLMCEFSGTLLHSNVDPMASYVWLNYGPPNDRYQLVVSQSIPRNDVWSPGRADPNAYLTRRREDRRSGEYTLVTNDEKTHMEQLDDLKRLRRWQYPNEPDSPTGNPSGICLREGRGGEDGLAFVTISRIEDSAYTVQTQVVMLDFARYHRRRVPAGGAE